MTSPNVSGLRKRCSKRTISWTHGFEKEHQNEANKMLLVKIAERKQADEKIREQAALLDKAHDEPVCKCP